MKGKLKVIWEKFKKLVWPFWGDDYTGRLAYFEDTGEEMGVVRKTIRDSNGNVAGYEIEDVKSGKVIQMSKNSFESTDRGLVFVPLWHSEAKEFIEEMELKSKMPELSDILSGGELSRAETGEVLKAHPEMEEYVKNAESLMESLRKRLGEFEEKRMEVRKKLMLLSEKRLLGEIDRREFAREIEDARRNARILEINIHRCRELIIRLENTPFMTRGVKMPAPREHEEIPALKDLMNDIPINVAVIDDSGKILSVNEQFTRNLAYDTGEIKGMNINELAENGNPENVFGVLDMDKPKDMEFTFTDGRGKKRKMFGRQLKIRNGGDGINVIAFQEKLEEGEEFRKIFAKQISHEFFNPLCIAQGYLYLLEEGKYGELTEKQRQQVKSISQSLNRIEVLVKETLKVKP